MADVSALVEARNNLAAKQTELVGLHQAKPDMRFTPDERKSIMTKTAELTDLKTEVEELVKLEESLKSAQAIGDYVSGKSGGSSVPTGGFPGGAGVTDVINPYTNKPYTGKSIGSQFIESEGFKNFSLSEKRGPEVKLETPPGFFRKTTLTETPTTGYQPQAIRTGLVLPTPLQRPMVADLLPQGQTSQIAIVYMLETTATNSAGAAAETVALGESALAFTQQSAPVETVGTFLPVTTQLMADAPAMSSYIDGRLRLFVMIAEDLQLLSGSGTPPNITGLLNAAGLQTQAKGTDNAISAILKAMTLIYTSTFLPPSGILIHPIDWQNIRLLQTTIGNFVLENPGDPNFFERLWGLPIVQSVNIAQGTALVGAFDTCAQMFRREDLTMAVSDSHSTFFTQRMLAIRADERFALAIYRPGGFCQVTGL